MVGNRGVYAVVAAATGTVTTPMSPTACDEFPLESLATIATYNLSLVGAVSVNDCCTPGLAVTVPRFVESVRENAVCVVVNYCLSTPVKY